MSDVTLNERQKLIASLPVFAKLKPKEIATLASLMDEVHYGPGAQIVEQDSLIDSIYIIVEGEAEVTQQFLKKSKIKKNKIIKTPIAMVHRGEAIGLSDAGFFSTTGKRTATVTAMTDMTLLQLPLKQLYDFFQQYPELKSEIKDATETLLRMKLIKQSLPFSYLSAERLQWLAGQIEEVTYPKGTVIFKQGDIGDRCFLIRSGKVEILAHEGQSKDHELAVLKPPILFGEATLITHSPRNATALALEDCELLVLQHKHLTELLESEGNVADMVMTLMVDRSRPVQKPDILVHQRVTADGQDIFILKNPKKGQYFKLSLEGWYIWQQLDGKQTMQEITLSLSDKYNMFAPNIVAALISKLAKGGFVDNVGVTEAPKKLSQPLWVRLMLRLRRILEARMAMGDDADKWLTVLYKKGASLFFTRIGKILLTLLSLGGILAFILKSPEVVNHFATVKSTFWMIILLIPFTLFSVALHELGHALATKSFGFEVHYMGVGWYWLGPVAFTDTSDMWLGTRWPRIFVNLAGVFTDTLTAGISALLIFVVPNIYIQCFLWIFALYTYINAFRMLSPLQDLDGYYVLMDLFDQPRLRRLAVLWLIKEFPMAIRQPRLFLKHPAAVSYWLACILYLFCICIITLVVQAFIFKILQLAPPNTLVSLLLPFLVVIISSLGIIADIRSQVEE